MAKRLFEIEFPDNWIVSAYDIACLFAQFWDVIPVREVTRAIPNKPEPQGRIEVPPDADVLEQARAVMQNFLDGRGTQEGDR